MSSNQLLDSLMEEFVPAVCSGAEAKWLVQSAATTTESVQNRALFYFGFSSFYV